MAFAPTPQQQAFSEALINTKENIALVARAGTGKTTTIIQGFEALAKKHPEFYITICAFNKPIAKEVDEKLRKAGYKDSVRHQAATVHSLGFSTFNRLFKSKVDMFKVHKIVDKLSETDEKMADFKNQIVELVSYAKQAGFGFFSHTQISNNEAWYAMADHYDVNGFDDLSQLEMVVEMAKIVYRKSLDDTDTVDFDDMILFPLVKNITVKFQKDVIFVDEAQDLSPARQALIKKFLKPTTGRLIIVGDDRQAIYGFSGADAEALNHLIHDTKAKVLPLSITWRCPKEVVKLAQTLVPDIEAAESNIDGVVSTVKALPELAIGDAVLCRNTAPLIGIAYSLIRQGIPAHVEGRKIGSGLLNIVNKWKVKGLDTFEKRLDAYEQREVQKHQSQDKEAKIEQIRDKCETIRQIVHALQAQNKHDVADLVAFIKSLFKDSDEENPKTVVLATYHRSKGREWNNVILFEHYHYCPSRAAKQDWEFQQEKNLAYVAFTRAKKTLTFVDKNAEG